MIRWLLIPPFRAALHGIQWTAYGLLRAWLDREPPAPPLPPLTDEDRAWIREQHRLTARPW